MNDGSPRPLVVIDSITSAADVAGAVVVCGSHAGEFSVAYALRERVAAVVLNDAGVGKHQAGIAGLEWAARAGMPAVAVDCWSARIGDGADTLACGVVAHVNAPARDLGVAVGVSVRDAVAMLAYVVPLPGGDELVEAWHPSGPHPAGDPWGRVMVVDSVSEMGGLSPNHLAMTGSHGGVVQGHAVKAPVAAAFFNDAGIGKDQAGIGRLALLEGSGVPAATVAAASARIGDGLDTYRSGIVSAVNETASILGVRLGDTATHAAEVLVRALESRASTTAHQQGVSHA